MTVILVVSVAAPAAAQQDSARRDTSGALDPITVTASRAPLPRTKIGTAVAVVTPEALRREPPRTAAAAVARATGTTLDEAAGPGGPTIVRIRGGEEVFSLILMDGVQVNQNGGFFDFQGLMLTNVDRIEVARGPQSALYGSSAVNGVVHFITRPGEQGPPRMFAEVAGGGASVYGGAARGTLAVRGGSPAFRYSGGVGAGYERGVFQLPHDIKSREASLRIDASPSRRLELSAVGRFVGMEANLPVRDPGATRVPLDPNAANTRDRLIGSTHATVRAGRLAHRFGASLYRESFYFGDRYDSVPDPGFFMFNANFHLTSRLLRRGFDYQGTLSTSWRGEPLTLAFGAQWERESLRDLTAGDFGSDTMAVARNGVAAFVEAHTALASRLNLLLGARTERMADLATQISPRANAILELSDVVSLRAAVGRAYKAPNLQQQFNPFIMPNPGLRPETSWSLELGTRVQPSRGLALEATIFRQTYADLIRTVRSDTDTTRDINRNIGRARAVGVEVEIVLGTPGGLRAEASATWLVTTVLDNHGLDSTQYPLNKPLPFRPGATATAAITTPFGRRLELVARGALIGQQAVLSERFSGQRVVLGAYALLGATLNLRANRNTVTFIQVENLLDRRYETGFDRRGLPRTATVGLRLGS